MENRFDLYDLPEGHEERFLEKLDAAKAVNRNRRTTILWTSLATAAAAVLLVLFLPSGNRHFFGVRTPEAVYCAYLDKVGSYYEQLALNGDAEEWEDALTALTGETIPLFDQLPDELSSREKVRVLKQYYGELLDAADLLAQEWKIN